MFPVGGEIARCRIVQETPNVVAEITFVDRLGAETVIENFDRQKVQAHPTQRALSVGNIILLTPM